MEYISLELEDCNSEVIVRELYDALGSGDAETVQRILASDLEWWFHGPPHCQHLMRFLTGRFDRDRLQFSPRRLTAVGNKVFVEGRDEECQYWVHVWTVEDGIVTQLREYFNTSLVVTEFDGRKSVCSPLWQSKLGKSDTESMPGLVLAV